MKKVPPRRINKEAERKKLKFQKIAELSAYAENEFSGNRDRSLLGAVLFLIKHGVISEEKIIYGYNNGMVRNYLKRIAGYVEDHSSIGSYANVTILRNVYRSDVLYSAVKEGEKGITVLFNVLDVFSKNRMDLIYQRAITNRVLKSLIKKGNRAVASLQRFISLFHKMVKDPGLGSSYWIKGELDKLFIEYVGWSEEKRYFADNLISKHLKTTKRGNVVFNVSNFSKEVNRYKSREGDGKSFSGIWVSDGDGDIRDSAMMSAARSASILSLLLPFLPMQKVQAQEEVKPLYPQVESLEESLQTTEETLGEIQERVSELLKIFKNASFQEKLKESDNQLISFLSDGIKENTEISIEDSAIRFMLEWAVWQIGSEEAKRLLVSFKENKDLDFRGQQLLFWSAYERVMDKKDYPKGSTLKEQAEILKEVIEMYRVVDFTKLNLMSFSDQERILYRIKNNSNVVASLIGLILVSEMRDKIDAPEEIALEVLAEEMIEEKFEKLSEFIEEIDDEVSHDSIIALILVLLLVGAWKDIREKNSGVILTRRQKVRTLGALSLVAVSIFMVSVFFGGTTEEGYWSEKTIEEKEKEQKEILDFSLWLVQHLSAQGVEVDFKVQDLIRKMVEGEILSLNELKYIKDSAVELLAKMKFKTETISFKLENQSLLSEAEQIRRAKKLLEAELDNSSEYEDAIEDQIDELDDELARVLSGVEHNEREIRRAEMDQAMTPAEIALTTVSFLMLIAVFLNLRNTRLFNARRTLFEDRIYDGRYLKILGGRGNQVDSEQIYKIFLENQLTEMRYFSGRALKAIKRIGGEFYDKMLAQIYDSLRTSEDLQMIKQAFYRLVDLGEPGMEELMRLSDAFDYQIKLMKMKGGVRDDYFYFAFQLERSDDFWKTVQRFLPVIFNVHQTNKHKTDLEAVVNYILSLSSINYLEELEELASLLDEKTNSNSGRPVGDGETDTAMPGGIDFNPAHVDLDIDRMGGSGFDFEFDPAMIQMIQDAPGLIPIIINISPITNLPMFLGLLDSNGGNPIVDFQIDPADHPENELIFLDLAA